VNGRVRGVVFTPRSEATYVHDSLATKLKLVRLLYLYQEVSQTVGVQAQQGPVRRAGPWGSPGSSPDVVARFGVVREAVRDRLPCR